jgi:hypothetical protein
MIGLEMRFWMYTFDIGYDIVFGLWTWSWMVGWYLLYYLWVQCLNK